MPPIRSLIRPTRRRPVRGNDVVRMNVDRSRFVIYSASQRLSGKTRAATSLPRPVSCRGPSVRRQRDPLPGVAGNSQLGWCGSPSRAPPGLKRQLRVPSRQSGWWRAAIMSTRAASARPRLAIRWGTSSGRSASKVGLPGRQAPGDGARSPFSAGSSVCDCRARIQAGCSTRVLSSRAASSSSLGLEVVVEGADGVSPLLRLSRRRWSTRCSSGRRSPGGLNQGSTCLRLASLDPPWGLVSFFSRIDEVWTVAIT